MKEINYILDKNELVKYMMQVHNDEYNGEISRIKLQKGLYFLFAFWVETITKSAGQHSEIEDLVEDSSKYLFEANFQAWAYGPVDYEVYDDQRNSRLVPYNKDESEVFLQKLDSVTQTYVYSMTRRIFNSSDFGLVDLSHRDSCWDNHYEEGNPYSNNSIPTEEIVAEYVRS